MPPQEGPKEFVRCPKAEATRMWLQCATPEIAQELVAEYANSAQEEGLLIEAAERKVIVSAGTNSFAQANTGRIFLFARTGSVVYEKEAE